MNITIGELIEKYGDMYLEEVQDFQAMGLTCPWSFLEYAAKQEIA